MSKKAPKLVEETTNEEQQAEPLELDGAGEGGKKKVRPLAQRNDFEIGNTLAKFTGRMPAARAVRILTMLLSQEQARAVEEAKAAPQ